MYLWKYWRESRITLLVSLSIVAALFAIMYRLHGIGNILEAGNGNLAVAFLAWRYGGMGVGRDLSQKSGSYLFTRPRSRAFFVWNDWGFAMAQILFILAALNLTLLYFALRWSASGSVRSFDLPGSFAAVTSLHCVTELLLAGLIFGLTYLCTILLKDSRGNMMSVGILLAYLITEGVLKYRWSLDLPGIMMKEFDYRFMGSGGTFASNLGLHIALRAGVVLLFPIGAQLLLQKRDID